MTSQPTGWIPPDQRTSEQAELDAEIKSQFLRPFGDAGPQAKPINAGDEYCLYKAFAGNVPHYAWQATGSCVGAGGYNALLTLQHVEIVLNGEAESPDRLFWPFTYGVSRRLAGFKKRGDGSFGSSWFKAIREFGMPPASESGLPSYADRNGWLWLGSDTENEWSYNPKLEDQYDEFAANHPIRAGSQVKSIEELDAALTNGYPCTIASDYGTKTIREKDGLMVARWDDSWAHQMFLDAVKNVSGNKYYRCGNNWGPDAHPSPSDNSPAGGFWIPENSMAKNLGQRYTECYALSGFDGFPVSDDIFWSLLEQWWKSMMEV